MDDERRKAILLALACLAILILLIIECAIMPRMGWLWIHHRRPRPRPARHVRQDTSSAEAASEPRHRGRAAPHQGYTAYRFEVDRWTWRRLDAARFDGERRHLLATRGRPWHADPEHGGETDALETWRLLAGRHQGGGMGLTVTGPGGKLDVSWEPDGAIPPDGRFYPNPDPPAAYPLLELERAGIIRPVEPAITVYGPYGRPTRLMEITEPYLNPHAARAADEMRMGRGRRLRKERDPRHATWERRKTGRAQASAARNPASHTATPMRARRDHTAR